MLQKYKPTKIVLAFQTTKIKPLKLTTSGIHYLTSAPVNNIL